MEDEKKPQASALKTVLLGLGLAVAALMRKGPPGGVGAGADEERKGRRMVLRGWIFVCAMAVLFVAYGLLAFFIIGDKGPPGWDYGSVPDVPAQSTYSTYPYREHAGPPEPQHVDQIPADALSGAAKEAGRPEEGPNRKGKAGGSVRP